MSSPAIYRDRQAVEYLRSDISRRTRKAQVIVSSDTLLRLVDVLEGALNGDTLLGFELRVKNARRR